MAVGGKTRQSTSIKSFAFVRHPSTPRCRLADAAINAKKHLDAFAIGELARVRGSEGEEVVDAVVDSWEVEGERMGFKGLKVVQCLDGEESGGSNGQFRELLEEGRAIFVEGKISFLIEEGFEIAGEAFRKALVHGEGVLRGTGVHAIGVGGFNGRERNRMVVREEVEVEIVEDAVGGGGVPFGFMGTFLERGEERGELEDRAIPRR
jgi:hypothetical protein